MHYNYPVHRRAFSLVIAAAILSGCSMQASPLGIGTPTLFVITSTLPPTPVPSITFTPIPPTPSPTTVPVTGLTSTQVNVRSEPSPSATQLGMLGAFTRVQVVGKNAEGDWYLILYSAGPGGTGWVTAQYISLQGTGNIPVVGGPAETPTPAEATGTPSASGTITQQVNVRKGPGTGFDAVGTLDAKETAELLGKDPTGSWLQIRYAAAPNGKGWIAAAYIDSAAIDKLPVIGTSAPVASDVGITGTAAPSPTPTATPAVAFDDGDSAASPGANVVFTGNGLRSLLYSSDLSAPQGDTRDFVRFTPLGGNVVLSLTCEGNTGLQTTLQSDSGPVAGWMGLSCGNTTAIVLPGSVSYLLELSVIPVEGSSAHVRYTIRVQNPG